MAWERYDAELTALADGELRGLVRLRLLGHLFACRPCAERLLSLRAAAAEQKCALRLPEAVDTERLLAETRRSIAALGEPRRVPQPAVAPAPAYWGRAAVAGAAALALVLAIAAGLVLQTGGVRPALVALGIETPPRQLVRNAEMFRDYEIIRELEALEYFESVAETPLEDDRAATALHHYG